MPRIHFPNIPLRLVLPADRAAAAATGVKELVFRTLPSVNKARAAWRAVGLVGAVGAAARACGRVSGACARAAHPMRTPHQNPASLPLTRARCAPPRPRPSSQIEIRTLLERLYQLPVSKVATANVEGKKKRSRGGMYRRPDFKLAYVKLSEAVKIPAPPKAPPKAEADAKPKA
jgi:hypothetical protein